MPSRGLEVSGLNWSYDRRDCAISLEDQLQRINQCKRVGSTLLIPRIFVHDLSIC